MKKNLLQLITLATLLCISTTSSQAQNEKSPVFGIEAYYGFPNLSSDIAVNRYQNKFGFSDYKLKDQGPLGCRAEFFVNKHIAFGVDAYVANSDLEWDYPYAWDPNVGSYSYNYHYHVNIQQFRILSKFNAHFIFNKYFDWYFGAGLGYNHTEVLLTSNDPKIKSRQNEEFPFMTHPIFGRVDVGGRYYFIKNLGIGFEVGLGGPLFSVGLSARI